MKKSGIVFIIIGSLLLLTAAAIVLNIIMFQSKESEHIGIIGGADAPTAIFLISRAGWKLLLIIAAGAALLIKGIIDNRHK